MIRRVAAPLVLIHAILVPALAESQSYSYDVNVDSVDQGTVFDHTFDLPAVQQISSIELEIAQTWGGDLEISLIAPDRSEYRPMFDTLDVTGDGNFDLGLVPGDPSLANVGTYTFVAPAGNPGFGEDYGPPGIYDATSWVDGPQEAGAWGFFINDDQGADPTSIGSITVNYVVLPEPSVGLVAFLLVGGLLGLAQRRRLANG